MAVDTGGTVVYDSGGYTPLFDGTFKDWYQECGTGHSEEGDVKGAIFRIGKVDGRAAIYTSDRDGKNGGVMMSRKRFMHYEVVFQMWPDFGNHGAFFNRSTTSGRSFSTTLDYIPGSSLGGTWGAGGFISRDHRPFTFGSDESKINIPGNGAGELSNWTDITRKLKAASEWQLPCPESGCTQTDWRTLWDTAGWNEIKIRFHGGVSGAGNKYEILHMKSWFRKPGSKTWIPLLQDTTLNHRVPPGHIGFLVHGGGRYTGKKGTWYRDIRWRELRFNGESIWPVDELAPPTLSKPRAEVRVAATARGLDVAAEGPYSISVTDIRGSRVEGFAGGAGRATHAFASRGQGVLILRIRTAQGESIRKVVRPPG